MLRLAPRDWEQPSPGGMKRRELRERTARLRRLDDILGGGDTFRVYLGEYQSTKKLLREASYSQETGRVLLSVLSEQAQQAGWEAFDAGRTADATGLYEASASAAAEAGDKELAGNALAFLAYQTLEVSRDQASRSPHGHAPQLAPWRRRVCALLSERLAWANAVAGNAAATEAALVAAEAALDEADDTPQRDWVAWVDRTELQIMTGRCWTELRRPLRAVPTLESALAQYSDTHARDKSLYLSWLATSYIHAGEIEQAAAVTGRALTLSAEVASARPRQRLKPVIAQLSSHRSLPAVADVLERAEAA